MSLSTADLNAMPWSLITVEGNISSKNNRLNDAHAIIDKDDKTKQNSAFGADGFTFADALDIINPLQHIPFIAPIYRQITGDTIDQGSKIAGATLFGGPIGFAAAMVNNIVENSTGKDIGENILAFFDDDKAKIPISAPTEITAKIANVPAENMPIINTSIVNNININRDILQAAKQISSQIIDTSNLKAKKSDDQKNAEMDNMEHNPNMLSNSEIKAYMQHALIKYNMAKYNQIYKLTS